MMATSAAGPFAQTRTRAVMPSILRTRELVKTYRMGEVLVPALRGIDLDIQEGEFLVLLGPMLINVYNQFFAK